MARPWKHPKTGIYHLRRAVPERLRASIGKREVKISLGTKDPAEARRLYPEAAVKADALFAKASGEWVAIALTHQQVVALCGVWYRRELEARGENPGDWPVWVERLRELREAAEHDESNPNPNAPSKMFAAVESDLDALLDENNLAVTPGTRQRLADHLFDTKVRLTKALLRRSEGDYGGDEAKSFPAWSNPTDEVSPSGLTFEALLEVWELDRKPPEKTAYDWGITTRMLSAFLGHDDPKRVTADNAVEWKEALLAEGKSSKTVFNRLANVRALFNWAKKNRRLTDNPFSGIGVAAKAGPGKKRLPFDDYDAALMLRAARQETGFRRWVPWLLAFTGARLEEICQALGTDIRKDRGVWYLDINADDEGKSLKNAGSARRVPLHPAIIAEGFLEFVEGRDRSKALFDDLKPDRFGKRGGTGTKSLGRWVRGLGIVDERKAPNHSWRHRFKDECREAGIEKAIHDALTGHKSEDIGDSYGSGYSLQRLYGELSKLPLPTELR